MGKYTHWCTRTYTDTALLQAGVRLVRGKACRFGAIRLLKKRPAGSFAFAREAKTISPLDVEAVGLIGLQSVVAEPVPFRWLAIRRRARRNPVSYPVYTGEKGNPV
jgi:hypothetical protein